MTENTNRHIVQIVLDTPVCTDLEFARRSGLSNGAAKSMMDRRLVPITFFGRRRMVNLAQITLNCLSGCQPAYDADGHAPTSSAK